MDLLLPYVVTISLFFLFLFLLVISLTGKKTQKEVPPGSKGWPILGENIALLMLGPEKFVKDRMEKHSAQVFQTSLLGEKVAVLCGVQGNKFLFTNEGKVVSSWWPKSLQKATLSPEFIETNFSQVLTLLHSLQADIFMPESLRSYMPIMNEVAAHHMDNCWNPTSNSALKLLPLVQKYTFEVASKLFLSLHHSQHIANLFHPFSLMLRGMFSVPVDFPGTPYNRAMRGSIIVRRELIRIIKERRKESINGGDVLSKMLLATDENGGFFSEMEIANNMLALLMASYETTSSAIASMINNLAQFPHVYQEVLKEQMEIARSKGTNEALRWEDIEKMKYSWNVARETLRFTPPVQGAFKEVTTAFTYAGFTIPKGWKAFWTCFSTHMNPNYFPEPHKFDPLRFAGSEPAPYTFVPFGGGRGVCPGKEFARLEILIFLHNLVTRFSFEKCIPDEKIVYYSSPKPNHGLLLRLHPHQKSTTTCT